MAILTESSIEQAALDWFGELGYEVLHGPDIAPGEMFAERADFGEVVLGKRLREALERLNPDATRDAITEAVKRIQRIESPSPAENNRRFHRLLTEGLPIEYRKRSGKLVHDLLKLVDFDDPDNNDWAVVSQFTVIEDRQNRRPDVVVFLNGLPIGVIELKNLADANATIKGAFNQLQTYKKYIPSLLRFNEVLVVSDGLEARAGTLTAGWERFLPWRTVDGTELAPAAAPQLETLVRGIFDRGRLLELLRHFIVFECHPNSGEIEKKMAGYHQFHAVKKAVECTVEASAPRGDRRVGVVWHTQGSGKSLSMVFYAGQIVLHPAMENPTLVMLTDRNDLDGQLHGTFCRCAELLRQTPEQAESREDLRRLLQRSSGGIIFTTIQKFLNEERGEPFPTLSERRNIVVIADEAHRSQYDFIDGYARNIRLALPKASFIGFTATPISQTDRSTVAVFGDYIDQYDIQRAVEDGATVRIYYEGRLAKLELKEEERPRIDPDFEEITEGEESTVREKLKSKWARLEAMVGTEKRIKLVARDLVAHFERRQDVMDGKAMIVCMSRRICVEMYKAITVLRPEWHDEDDERGAIKVVMTGSATDALEWQPHIHPKAVRERLADRFKDPDDPLKIVLVRDMWLTGFDVPCLHTMYVDKPMQGHGLMQAIARVNRVYRDKPGGLIVDYLGLADQLKRALADYTEGDRAITGVDQEQAVEAMLKHYEVACALFHGFDWSKFKTGKAQDQLNVIGAAVEHVLKLEDGRKRLLDCVTALSRAFALAVPHDKAMAIRDDVGFFQAVRAALVKTGRPSGGRSEEDLDVAIRQIVSRAVASDRVVDIFAAAGLKTPDISILSDEFLAEVRRLPHRNLALELLKRLLNDEIKARMKTNLVQSRSFAQMLEEAIRKYQNRSIETAQVIAELIEIAKQMREARNRGESLGLAEDEVAFYDALEVNDSAVKVLGDENLRFIARELTKTIRNNVTIDWTMKESARARLRVLVKRVLRQWGYPPDKQEKATQTVIEQAELLCAEWAPV